MPSEFFFCFCCIFAIPTKLIRRAIKEHQVSFFPGLHAPVGGTELAALFAAGTLLGDAPDIDVLFYFLKKKTTSPDKLSAHRTYITHAPVVWLLLGLSIFFLSSAFGLGSFWCILGLLVWLCPWSHFLCDSIAHSHAFIKPTFFYSRREFQFETWIWIWLLLRLHLLCLTLSLTWSKWLFRLYKSLFLFFFYPLNCNKSKFV